MELPTRENQILTIDAGLERHGLSQHKLEKLAEIKIGTIKDLRRGKRPMNAENWAKICRVIKTTISQVVGHTAEGGRIVLYDNDAQGAGLEEVERPLGSSDLPADIVAVRVLDNHMEPMVESGWLLFYERQKGGIDSKDIGKLCTIKLASGELLVRKIQLGSSSGLYHLISKNPDSAPLFDQKLLWASRILDIRPA